MKRKTPKTPLDEALAECRGSLGATAVFSLFINLLMFVSPLYMLNIYDRVLSSRNETTLLMITIVAGGMLVVYALLEMIRSRVLVRIGIGLDQSIKGRVFSSVFDGFLRNPGGGHAQAVRDLDAVREFLTGSGLLTLCDAPWVPIFIAACFYIHPYLGLLAAASAVIIFILALANELATRTPLREASSKSVGATNYVGASLRNAEVLRAMGMLPAIRGRWTAAHNEALALQSHASNRAGLILAGSKFFRIFSQVGVLGLGALLAIEQEISPGAMIAASILMGRALAPVEMAVGNWKGFVHFRVAYARLQALFQAAPDEEERMPLPAPTGAVSLEAVVAVPPGQKTPVLRGISFALRPGDSLGVIGPSAAGKSSLARVLVGVWPTLSGAVRIDGAELRHWLPEELGPHIGYLPQDVELFKGTVAENIARFGEIDPVAVVEAARKAGVHDMIQQLAEGYDTQIGEGGAALSGGQRQRLGLARALYASPAFVVLDEPNASLDQAGEEALAQAMASMKADGQTVVVITHRPNLLSLVDRILVMKAGTVQALGPRDQVLSQVLRPAVVGTQPTPPAKAAASMQQA